MRLPLCLYRVARLWPPMDQSLKENKLLSAKTKTKTMRNGCTTGTAQKLACLSHGVANVISVVCWLHPSGKDRALSLLSKG